MSLYCAYRQCNIVVGKYRPVDTTGIQQTILGQKFIMIVTNRERKKARKERVNSAARDAFDRSSADTDVREESSDKKTSCT